MSDYLDEQFKTLKAIKDVSNTSSLSTSELFKVFVEMRQGVDLVNTQTAEATGNDLFKVNTDTEDDETIDDTDAPPKVLFQLAGVDMAVSEDDGCELDENGRIVDDLA